MSLHLMFIPGFLCDERLFHHQVVAFRDTPGIASVHVADISCRSSIEAMAEDVLAAAPEQVVLIGLSLGGIVATEVAHRAPSRITGVAVLDTNLAEPDEHQLAARRRWEALVDDGDWMTVVKNEIVDQVTRFPDEHGPLVMDMAARAGADAFRRQNEALLHRRDRRDDLAALRVPVLVACGSEDRLCPPDVQRDLAGRVPGSDLVVVSGAGHLATVDRPEALTALLRTWLTNLRNTPLHQLTGGSKHEHT